MAWTSGRKAKGGARGLPASDRQPGPRDWSPTDPFYWAPDDQAGPSRKGPPPHRRSRWKGASIVVVLVLVGIAGLAAAGSGNTRGGVGDGGLVAVEGQSTTAPLAPATSVSPPVTAAPIPHDPLTRDLNDDAVCAYESFTVLGSGTLVNRGSDPASYTVHVTFHDAQGVRFAEGIDHASNVRPGEAIAWEALGLEMSPPEGWTCQVVAVDRLAVPG